MRRLALLLLIPIIAFVPTVYSADLALAPAPAVPKSAEDARSVTLAYLQRKAALLMLRANFSVIAPQNVEEALIADVEAMGPGGLSEDQQVALDHDIVAEGSYYIVSLRYLIEAGGAVWPTDRPERTYVNDALSLLRDLQNELLDGASDREDPLPVLRKAQEIWSWTEGLSHPPADRDAFAGRDGLVESILSTHGPWART